MAVTATIQNGLVQLSGNPVWITVEGGTVPQGATDYKYLLKVISSDGNLDGAPFTDAIAPDSAGKAMFDISGLVDQPVKKEFEHPESSVMVAYTNQVYNVKVVPGELYIDANGDLQETWGSESDVFSILKGGVSQRQLNQWNTDESNFYLTYIEGKRWLTYRIWADSVHPDQPVKLYFMPAENASVNLELTCVYDDGSTASFVSPHTIAKGVLYEFQVNPKKRGVEVLGSGKKVVFWDAALTQGESLYSNSHRFYYDWQYCERPFYLIFANSIGGVDDVYMPGFAMEKFTSEGTTVSRPAAITDTVTDPTLVVPNRKGRNVWVLNTGYKSTTAMRHLRDLLLSRQAWLLFPNKAVTNYIVIPVILEPGEVTLIDYNNDLYQLDIEVSEAFDNQFGFNNALY